ncbi:MAG: thiamine pyrophosphate-dependent enzyme [Thermoplasmata archaeon]
MSGIITTEYIREKYLRRLPTAFCPGCGDGQILGALIRAIEQLNIPKNEIVTVSGIGCSAWIPSPYLRIDSLHTTHGRPIAFATGVKAANPKLKVIVVTGDGDAVGIGGNHLLHAARTNIGLTVIMVNNAVYAMTGGQVAPTTPHEAKTSTTPYGNPAFNLNVSEVVAAAGASYVARWTTWHINRLIESIKKAMNKKGFSFIEVISQCPTYGGRLLNMDHIEMLHYFRDNFRENADGMFRIGEFVDVEKPELTDELEKLIMKVKS